VQPLEDDHREPGAGEVGGTHEGVVAAADDHHVIAAPARVHRVNVDPRRSGLRRDTGITA
jgi:hypothetical protein